MIKFVLGDYNLHEDSTCDGHIIMSGELVVKEQYLC